MSMQDDVVIGDKIKVACDDDHFTIIISSTFCDALAKEVVTANTMLITTNEINESVPCALPKSLQNDIIHAICKDLSRFAMI